MWSPARTSSATPSCSAASAPAACTPSRSRSPPGCSARPWTTCPMPARVRTWSLQPQQLGIANQVFSPSVDDVAHARRVVAAMGDGTGAVMLDGKMEDDASLKQCLVMVRLAEQLSAVDPQLKQQYDAIEVSA